MKRYIILGGGIAALSAATAIRKHDPSGLIVMLTEENALPYARTMLTKQLMKDVSPAGLALRSAAWYDAPGRDILPLTGRKVAAIDPQGKTVTLADGLVFPYDKLIYALGARCFIPAFTGNDHAHVVAVRTAEDAARVCEMAKTARTAAVIGGGVLGLEAAWALHREGLAVAVVEFAPRLMPRQLEEEESARVGAAIEAAGAKLYLSASAAGYDGNTLTLQDGRNIPADMVIVSAGVRANAEIAQAAGIRVERKILVDERMQTSAPDIYAAGDCAEHGVSYALWSEASEMGEVAGTNAAGGEAIYKPVPRKLHFEGFGVEVEA